MFATFPITSTEGNPFPVEATFRPIAISFRTFLLTSYDKCDLLYVEENAMKTVLLVSILFWVIVLPVIGELTPEDLDKIRLLIQEENKPIKDDIATLKNNVSWMRGKLEGIDKQVTHSTNVTYGLIALIVAAIGVPQIIMAWRSGKDRQQERINPELRQEIEELKQKRIISP